MKRYVLSMLPILLSSAALAHPSLMPHSHPHGLSPLAGIDVFLLMMLALAVLGLVSLRRG